jgi:hypothetical protein
LPTLAFMPEPLRAVRCRWISASGQGPVEKLLVVKRGVLGDFVELGLQLGKLGLQASRSMASSFVSRTTGRRFHASSEGFVGGFRAPSAVCTSEMAPGCLPPPCRAADLRAHFSEIARPAALSAALLIA